MDNIIISVNKTKKGYMLYIGTEQSSLAKYKCKNIKELKKTISNFINDYLDYAEKFNNF